MVKSITLNISSNDDISSSCIVEASMIAENIQMNSPSRFTLSSLNNSLDKFEKWKNSLKQYIPVRREQVRGAIAYRQTRQSCHLSETESYQQCERSKDELFNSFNQLLNDDSLQSWLREILDSTVDPVRVIIQTDSLEIATLPWEQWSFWDSYYHKNDLVIALSFLDRLNLRVDSDFKQKSPSTVNVSSSQTRILVVLGEKSHNKNDINLEIDRKEFQQFEIALKNLGDRANVDIHICQPNRTELEQVLQDTWHIIYYGGHSQTLDLEKDGVLYLQEQTQVKISELETIFKQLIACRELRLLIANACQGLGTAFRLIPLGLPHALVMRESIPDDFAHDFLRYLLESFIIGLPATSIIQHCKPHLRKAYDLRHKLPGASLLPALCLTSESVNEIDTPIIPLDGLHPICKEMRALANLAKARLTLEDAENVTALQVQEYYANLLNHKNKVTHEQVKTEIKLEQLSCSSPRIVGKLIWEINFRVNIQAQNLIWGQGYVNIKTGNSELLLDVRPWSWTGTPAIIQEEEIAQLSLVQEAEPKIDDKLQKLSFTKFALLNLEKEYKKYICSLLHFDGVSKITNFGGWLKDFNKKKFLKELVILQEQGFSEHEAFEQAYLKTPFGKARYELGITDFKVTSSKETFAPLIEVMEKDEWTEKDYKNLRESGVPDELWWRLNVPQHIIVSVAKRPQ